MNKISVVIHNGYLSFNKFNKTTKEEDLNNTNVIDTKNIKFTEDYILSNLELVSAFLNLIIVKFEIKQVKIRSLDIAESTLKLIKLLPNIEEITFSEDKELNYSLSSLLLENINLQKINCYNLPEIMFDRFKDGVLTTRSEYLFLSNFMKNNNINTYSGLCNKDKITINGQMNVYDFADVKYFLEKNTKVKKIYLHNYLKNTLINILELLKDNAHKGVNIIIVEKNDVTKSILEDIKLFEKFSKKYNVKIKIKYSKEYKEKNNIKEVNIKFFRIILIVIIFILIAVLLIYNYKNHNDLKNTEENVEMINKVIENVNVQNQEDYEHVVEETDDSTDGVSYVGPYSTDYSKVYNELVSINSDTVGWLTVNNTNINYPIVQTDDNEYYLKHAYDKSTNQAGWLFVDYRNNLDNMNQNTIIYGHNVIKNDVMFGSLKYVLNPSWYTNDSNLNITFNIKNANYTWRVFSIYVIDAVTDYLQTDFSTYEDYLTFLNMLKSRSIYDFNVDFDEDDKILTLSTCHETNSRRLVLHAKLIK